MRGLPGCALVALVLTAGGCGGGERQDADEPSGSYRLEVVRASFPTRQSLADRTQLQILVRNADSEAAPNVAVTISTDAARGSADEAFSYALQGTGLADRSRPIWVVEESPIGGDTAATNTWALGKLQPGATRRFTWRLTAVRPGTFTVGYTVSPGLAGRARPAGGDNTGSFRVRISGRAPEARVDDAGNVVRGSSGAD